MPMRRMPVRSIGAPTPMGRQRAVAARRRSVRLSWLRAISFSVSMTAIRAQVSLISRKVWEAWRSVAAADWMRGELSQARSSVEAMPWSAAVFARLKLEEIRVLRRAASRGVRERSESCSLEI